MRAFSDLYSELDRTTRTLAKVRATKQAAKAAAKAAKTS